MVAAVQNLERLQAPDGTTLLRSRSTPGGMRYEVVVGGRVAMSACDGISERALADSVLGRRGAARSARVLVGGLGLGITLAAVLAHRCVRSVVVAEIEPSVIRWNRSYLREVNGDALADPRVRVVSSDVADLVRDSPSSYDAILLDVDNGPSMLLRAENAVLYARAGLGALRAALRPGGVLALWCNREEADLDRALCELFGNAHIDRIAEPGYRHGVPPTAIHSAVLRSEP